MWTSRYSRAPARVRLGFLVFAAVGARATLAVAHAFQTFGHLAPCELCLHQREGYWLALAVATAGLVAVRLRRIGPAPFTAVLGLVFLG